MKPNLDPISPASIMIRSFGSIHHPQKTIVRSLSFLRIGDESIRHAQLFVRISVCMTKSTTHRSFFIPRRGSGLVNERSDRDDCCASISFQNWIEVPEHEVLLDLN